MAGREGVQHQGSLAAVGVGAAHTRRCEPKREQSRGQHRRGADVPVEVVADRVVSEWRCVEEELRQRAAIGQDSALPCDAKAEETTWRVRSDVEKMCSTRVQELASGSRRDAVEDGAAGRATDRFLRHVPNRSARGESGSPGSLPCGPVPVMASRSPLCYARWSRFEAIV